MSEDYLNIKNYTFEKDIGEGNFGKVKLAIFKKTNEEFAIKILSKEKIKQKMKNTIFQENEIITKFNHINIAYVYQIIEDENNYYIVMEYCKHGELFDYIVKNQKLSEIESSIFFYQLINGVEYIHKLGISHRDLKPENLLLAENNILKIIDFGLSHEFNGDKLLQTKCGSPSYAAPEIIYCSVYDGFKIDIWCCGIILYAMLCGYLPFEGENNDILFKNILECNPEMPEFLSDVSKDMLKKILTTNPKKRIDVIGIKKHEFYLMGKKNCNLDYDIVEKNIIQKRKRKFNKNKIYLNNENSASVSSNSDKKNHIILTTMNSGNLGNKEKKVGNDNFYKTFRKSHMSINTKYNNKINSLNIQQILTDDINQNFIPIQNKNKVPSPNTKTNFVIQCGNFNNNVKILHEDKKIGNELLSNLRNKKNTLFLKIFESTKNKIFKNQNLSGPRYDSQRELNKLNEKGIKTLNNNKKNKNRQKLIKSLNKSKNGFSQKKNSKIFVPFFSNENIFSDKKHHDTYFNNDTYHKRYNSFKDSMNIDSGRKFLFTNNNINTIYNKSKKNILMNNKNNNENINNNCFINFSDRSIRKTSSRKIFKSPDHSSSKEINIKDNNKGNLNLIGLNPTTFFYNNININIKEININSKKETSRLLTNLNRNLTNKIKKDNNKIMFGTSNSAKRIFSAYNKNSNTIKIFNCRHNLNSITNNFNNLGKNMRFVFSEKNIFKDKIVLPTEPKNLLRLKNQKSSERKNNKCETINNEESNLYSIRNNQKSKTDKISKKGYSNSLRRLNTKVENSKRKNNNFDKLFMKIFEEPKKGNKKIPKKNNYQSKKLKLK